MPVSGWFLSPLFGPSFILFLRAFRRPRRQHLIRSPELRLYLPDILTAPRNLLELATLLRRKIRRHFLVRLRSQLHEKGQIRQLDAHTPKSPPRYCYFPCDNYTKVRHRHMSHRWVLFFRPVSFPSRIICTSRPLRICVVRRPNNFGAGYGVRNRPLPLPLQ